MKSIIKLITLLLFICTITSCGMMDDDSSALDEIGMIALFNDEIVPEGSSDTNGFDATLEEVLHLVSQYGYAEGYPDTFGETTSSTIASYMDTARGGTFLTVPATYPDEAWYHYDDTTCDYSCQITEYFYWALTSMLGAQDYGSRAAEIADEWECPTPSDVLSTDPNIYTLFSTGSYAVPSVLPDGDYPTDETVDFTIETTLPDTLEALEDYFNRYINVFDLNVIATDSVDEDNLLHAAYVLAEYLDNNEDGIVDDTTVLNALLDNNGTVVITEDEDELEQIIDEIE